MTLYYILKSLQKICQFYPCDIGLCWRVFFKNLCTWMCLLNCNFLKIHTKFMQIGCLHVVTYVRFTRFGRDVPLGSGHIHYSNFPRKSDTFLYRVIAQQVNRSYSPIFMKSVEQNWKTNRSSTAEFCVQFQLELHKCFRNTPRKPFLPSRQQ